MKLLAVDEILMISGELLDRLNVIAKILRKSVAPFDKIQFVTAGDLLQLPPVCTDGSVPKEFQSEAWESCKFP